MDDQTQQFKKPQDSHFFNVSLRGIICLLIVGTVCFMSLYQLEVKEPLYTLAGMVIGYYFAQNKKDAPSKSAQN